MFEMNPVSTASTVAFVSIVFIVAVAWVAAVYFTAEPGTRKRRTGIAALAVIAWLVGHAVIVGSGLLNHYTMPPPVLLYLVATGGFVIWISTRPAAMTLAVNLPLGVLVGFHAFRLPLEIVLHSFAEQGALPVRMTYEGANFDIVTGITAIVVGLTASKLPRLVLAAWNVMGLGLLFIVVSIAVLSGPTPVRQFFDEPAVTLAFNPPFTWIASVLVMSALAGHILVFRRLRSDVQA